MAGRHQRRDYQLAFDRPSTSALFINHDLHQVAGLDTKLAVPSTDLGMGAAVSMYMFPALAIVVLFTLLSLRRED